MRRGQISRFVRGKDRKESLSRQMRMDQLKDRFQFAGGSKDKPNTSDDEDTYGPKISGAVKAEKIPTSLKPDPTDSNSDSQSAGEMGGKRKCKEVIDDLPCKKVLSVSEGEAGQSNVETGCSTLTVKKHSDLKESECGMNVQETNRLIDSQRAKKKECSSGKISLLYLH